MHIPKRVESYVVTFYYVSTYFIVMLQSNISILFCVTKRLNVAHNGLLTFVTHAEIHACIENWNNVNENSSSHDKS